MRDLIIALIGSGGITFLLGWLSGRKKKKADLEGKRLENLQNTLDIYDRVHEDLKRELDELSEKCSRLSNQISELRRENETLKREIHTLTQKLRSTTRQ